MLAPLWGAAKKQGPSLVVQIRKITPIPAQDIYPPLSPNKLDKLHIRENMGEGKKAPQNFKSMSLPSATRGWSVPVQMSFTKPVESA